MGGSAQNLLTWDWRGVHPGICAGVGRRLTCRDASTQEKGDREAAPLARAPDCAGEVVVGVDKSPTYGGGHRGNVGNTGLLGIAAAT